jgi:hypothetical protein
MADYPPLNRFYVASYAANDRDYPVVAIRLDPRVAGYKVPEDLSPHPDSKRYPNHVFTGAQPSSGDQIVTHIYEILPAPWVPFTRYDDDLGPIQGRRRAVKNEGQQADLASDRKISYEGREGSAIVSLEIEETWSIKVDEDGNSLFPIKDRDFYDASRGAVQERRQLFVPTGEEVGSLENVNGVITQTSYEPYNEFLSVKIVQTYKVDGPQLIGRATDNDGQLITVTTQRRGALNYIPPNPTATRTVEVSREDAESLVERIVDTPEIFKANTFSVERPDPIPQKFRVAVPIQSSQEIVEGDADPNVSLDEGELSKSEEQRNKFIKRVSSTSRDQAVLPQTLTGKSTNNERQEVTVTETLQLGNTDETPTATKTVESEALGDGNYVITKTQVDEVFSAITFSKERPDPVPPKFRTAIPSLTRQENLEGEAEEPTLVAGEIVKSEQQVNQFVKRISTTARDAAQLPKSLTQKLTTNEGLLATVTETLQNGDTTAVPTSKKTVESEALGDGTYVVRVTESPKVFSAKTFRAEKADLTPQKFRAKQSDLTTEENIEGTAAQPTLGENQFLKSEQQINEFVKRVTTNTRTTEISDTLDESVITPEGQLATRTITLSKSAQTLVPSATVIDGNVEELGDGRTVKTEVRVDEVFDGKQESLEKPEVIPPEFRASLQNRTISEIKTGQAISLPSLSQEELSKTIQRVTEHKIRETKVTRPSDDYPKLTGELVDNDQIKVTRTRTVAKGGQTITPSATVSGSVEALGDGYTLKTEDTKEKFFEGKSFSQEKPDNIPVEFRAEKPVTIEEFTEEGDVQEVSLADDEISKSEQQVTEFLKRTRTATRDIIGGVTLEGEQIDQDGIKVTVTRSLQDGTQSIAPSATTSGQVEAIGGGKTIKTELEKSEVFNARTLTRQQAFQLPAKFVTGETEEESFIEESKNAEPEELGDNGTGIVQSTAQRVTAFTVRKTTRTVDGTTSTTEKQLSNSGQEITIESEISDDSSIETGAKVEIARTQAIGGGKFLKEIGKVEEVFNSKQRTFTQAAQIPAKFLDGKITETNFIEEGTTEEPEEVGSDGFGVVQSSSQRVNAFLRRQTQREQEGTTSLTEQQTNNFNQRITVTSSIVDDPEVEPSAKTEFARTQAIGGGKYVKEVGVVDSVFPETTRTRRQGAQIPQAFVDGQNTFTRIEEGTNDEPEELSENGYGIVETSAQRITENKVRRSRTGIDVSGQTVTTKVFTQELGGGLANLTQKLNSPIAPSFGTISAEETSIGGGATVSRELVLAAPPALAGEDYDEVTSIQIPFTQQFVEAGEEGEIGSSITPRDVFHSQKRTIDIQAAKKEYLKYEVITDDVVSINLPDVLESIEITVEQIEGGQNSTATGNSSQAQCTASADWEIAVRPKISSGASGSYPASKHIFFIDPEDSTALGFKTIDTGFINKPPVTIPVGTIIERTQSNPFPLFRPQSQSFNIIVESERVVGSASVSLPDNKSESISSEKNVRIQTVTLPFCINTDVSLAKTSGNFVVEKNAKAEGPDVSTEVKVKAEAKYRIEGANPIPRTPPYEFIPSGRFLYSVNTQLYRFGLVKVEATIVTL